MRELIDSALSSPVERGLPFAGGAVPALASLGCVAYPGHTGPNSRGASERFGN